MGAMNRPALLLVAAVSLAAAAAPPADPPRWQALDRAARQALEARDYAALRRTLLELRPLMPGNPRVLYNLAAAQARLGEKKEALAGLRALAAMGLYYDLVMDEDFADLRGTPEFAAVLGRVEENRRPVSRSRPAFALLERDLLPEDLAYDPKTRRFFVSSARRAKIVTGDGREFARTGWPALALRVDAERRLLWVATGWVPPCERCDRADEDKSALLALDLDSGAERRRIGSPVRGLLGDMTLGRRGDLYVSEGIHGAVLRLRAGAKALERLDAPGEFASPQTPALSADEKTLYVPDYLRGVAALDLATRAVRWLQTPLALSGIDGLYRHGDSFVAVQNGASPPRIVRFSRDLRRQEVLEANWPGLGEPTHGTLVGDSFYFLTNTGWGEYDDQGRKRPGSAPVESAVRALPL